MRISARRTFRRIGFALFAGTLLIGVLATVPAGATTTTTISGTVTASVGGANLAGICVDEFPVGGGTSTGTDTSANGTYTISGLAPGSYYVQFIAGQCGGNYVSQWYNGTVSGASSESGALAVAVTVATPATGINAVLAPGASISGTVTAAIGGADLAGICTVVFPTGGHVGAGSAVSSANGTYTISGLAPGSYDINFGADCGTGNYVAQWYNGTATGASFESGAVAVTVAPASPATVINAAMAPSTSISGVVTAAVGGADLAGICVNEAPVGGGISGSATTAANGAYTISGLAAGSYDINFDPSCGSGNFVAQWYNGTTAGASSQLGALAVVTSVASPATGVNASMAPSTSISGTVTAAVGGADLAGVCVDASSLDGLSYSSATTASNGTYTISGLAPGNYYINFDPSCVTGNFVSQFYNGTTAGASSQSGAVAVSTSAASPAAGINAVLVAGTTISGTVTAAIGGADLAGVCVSASSPDGLSYSSTNTAADGTYTISGLIAGSYDVNFDPSCGTGNFVSQFYNDTPAGASSQQGALAVSTSPASPATGINAALATGTTISGTVTAAIGGADLAGVCVSAVSLDGSSYSSATTATDGTYTISGLTPGSYLVQFTASCGTGNFVSQFYNDTAAGVSSQRGAVAVSTSSASPATGINAALAAGTTISGTVTAAVGGADLAGVCVTAASPDGFIYLNSSTAANGTYTISGLAAGSYTVQFNSGCGSTNFAEQYYNASTGTPLQSGSSVVSVTLATPATGVNAAMLTGATISGVVSAAVGGADLANVCVDATSTDTGAFESATTAANGTYTINSLPGDTYTIAVDPTCGSSVASSYAFAASGTPLIIAAGSTTNNENFALVAGGSISDVITPSHPAPTSATVGGTTYAPSASATSGDEVAITLDATSTGCALNAGVVSFTAVGTCTVDFNDPSSGPNDAYAAAAQVQQTFSVAASSGGGGSTTGPTNAPPPSGLSTSDYGTPVSGTASSTAATTVTQSSGGASVTVNVQAAALPAGTTVSVYPVTDTSTLTAAVPTGQSYVLSLAVSWETSSDTSPTASTPITMTITDPSIKAGDTLYELTSTGLVAVGAAAVDGSATITFSNDPVFVVTQTNLAIQSALTLTSLKGTVGTALTLATSGGSGTGAVTFTAADGSATGCVVSGSSLSSNTAGTCVVTAAKAADATYLAASSTATTVSLALPARPTTVTVADRGKGYALSPAAKRALLALSKKLLSGASVTITGYAKANKTLAKNRAEAAAHFLAARANLHIKLVFVTRTTTTKVTVATTKQ